MTALTLLNWNLQWARKCSPRGRTILNIVQEIGAHVVCLTEANASFLDESGHTIASDADYGYPIQKDRRKVMLWSKEPWENVDTLGNIGLPGGRFIAGATTTPLGKLRVIGVCIPWSFAHVTTGQRNKKPWDDHLAFITHLKPILASSPEPTVLLGDFNQTLPRSRAPIRAEKLLRDAVMSDFKIATENLQNEAGAHCIDHIAHTHTLTTSTMSVVPKISNEGLRLSDHFGVHATMRLAEI